MAFGQRFSFMPPHRDAFFECEERYFPGARSETNDQVIDELNGALDDIERIQPALGLGVRAA